MKIQCDACESAAATIVCCADEAALCARCDVEIHAANKLAGKHQRLPLECLAGNTPKCDICQEKPAFIFCVEDRALFCRDCDEPIHVPGTLSGGHQRYLATGIRIGLNCLTGANSGAAPEAELEAPSQTRAAVSHKRPPSPAAVPAAPFLASAWEVDEFLQMSDGESTEKVHKEGYPLELKELEWFADIGLFPEQPPSKQKATSAAAAAAKAALATAEVPELAFPRAAAYNSASFFRPNKPAGPGPLKKARLELADDEDFLIVPDLG